MRSIFLFFSQTSHLHWTTRQRDRYYGSYFRGIKTINLRMRLQQRFCLHWDSASEMHPPGIPTFHAVVCITDWSPEAPAESPAGETKPEDVPKGHFWCANGMRLEGDQCV